LIKRLGEILIERGKLDPANLERALRLQEADGKERIGAILVKAGMVAERDMMEALGSRLDLPLVAAADYPELPVLEERVSVRFLKESKALPLYRYKAVAPTGESQEGEMEGLGQSAVVERLQGMGLIPIRVEEATASTGGGSAGKSLFRKNRISQANIAVFTQEIATLLHAGLPLDRSLGNLTGLSANPQVLQLLTPR